MRMITSDFIDLYMTSAGQICTSRMFGETSIRCVRKHYMHYLFTHWIVSLAGTLFLGLSAMVLHEMGHVVTSLMVGIRVKSIGLCMKGMYIVREAGTPMKNLLISLAGPLTNVALILIFH